MSTIDNPSIYRKHGVRCIQLMVLLIIVVSVLWAALDLSWRIWVPTLITELVLFGCVTALVFADIREDEKA